MKILNLLRGLLRNVLLHARGPPVVLHMSQQILILGRRFNRSLVRTGFRAGFEIALEPSKLQKEGENPGKGHFRALSHVLPSTATGVERQAASQNVSC